MNVVYGSALVAGIVTMVIAPVFVKPHPENIILGWVAVGYALAAAWGVTVTVAYILSRLRK